MIPTQKDVCWGEHNPLGVYFPDRWPVHLRYGIDIPDFLGQEGEVVFYAKSLDDLRQQMAHYQKGYNPPGGKWVWESVHFFGLELLTPSLGPCGD